MKKKPKVGKLTFRPVLTAKITREGSMADQFQAALHASDRVTMIETPRTITIKLRKRSRQF